MRMHSTGSPVMAPSSVRTAGACLGRRQRIEQDMQRQQHQPDADGDAAEIPRAGLAAALEGNHADQNSTAAPPPKY